MKLSCFFRSSICRVAASIICLIWGHSDRKPNIKTLAFLSPFLSEGGNVSPPLAGLAETRGPHPTEAPGSLSSCATAAAAGRAPAFCGL